MKPSLKYCQWFLRNVFWDFPKLASRISLYSLECLNIFLLSRRGKTLISERICLIISRICLNLSQNLLDIRNLFGDFSEIFQKVFWNHFKDVLKTLYFKTFVAVSWNIFDDFSYISPKLPLSCLRKFHLWFAWNFCKNLPEISPRIYFISSNPFLKSVRGFPVNFLKSHRRFSKNLPRDLQQTFREFSPKVSGTLMKISLISPWWFPGISQRQAHPGGDFWGKTPFHYRNAIHQTSLRISAR